MAALLDSSEEPYLRINRLRDWCNTHLAGFELFLEDVWPRESGLAGVTLIEYRLRSLRTLEESVLLAQDCYTCHCDAHGVWHLDDWQSTDILIPDVAPLLAFLEANGAPWHRDSSSL